MAYYRYTILKLRMFICKKNTISSAEEMDLAEFDLSKVLSSGTARQDFLNYILWMLKKIEEMEPDKPAKAARWIGWVLAYMEMLGFMTNSDSRNFIRVDVS